MKRAGDIKPLVLSLGEMANSMNVLADDALAIYTPIVDELITTKASDTKIIERTLDSMLGFCFKEQMVTQYQRLCRYYYYLDPQASADYVQFYREMWDDEGDL